MTTTTKLGLELLQNAAANQTLSNTTFAQLNQLVQPAATDRLATPPVSPANEALYIIIATAAGVWAGKESHLAYWLASTGAWQFITPREGMLVHVNNEDEYYKYDGSAWGVFSGGGGGVSGDMLSTLSSSEVAITGAATLTSTAFGKMHVCSGTSADYTVGLPAASGNPGKIIGFRMAPSLTKIVTLDGNASELIDGALVRKLWANETALLLCDGTAWVKIAGKSIPMSCGMYPTAATTIALNPTLTTIPLAATIYDKGGLANAGGNRINAKRAGLYRVSANNYFQAGGSSATETQCIVNLNSTSGGVGSYTEWRTVPAAEPLRVQFETDISLSAGDYLQLVGRIGTATRSLYVNDPNFTFLKIAEVIEW